jgi:hypothetical protein
MADRPHIYGQARVRALQGFRDREGGKHLGDDISLVTGAVQGPLSQWERRLYVRLDAASGMRMMGRTNWGPQEGEPDV